MRMTKRIETNVTPVNRMSFKHARIILNDPHATANEKRLALMVEECGRTINLLLAKLEFGQVSISDEPPEDNMRRCPTNRDD
jgi:hypothetical protein